MDPDRPTASRFQEPERRSMLTAVRPGKGGLRIILGRPDRALGSRRRAPRPKEG